MCKSTNSGIKRQHVIGIGLVMLLCAVMSAPAADTLETQFKELPMAARRLTGPLFWMHGDKNETQERLEAYVEKVAEGGNGSFTAESRPHSDWLGPRWYRDLDICLQKAKELDLQMWIFDERWWPSQSIGGKVPPRYAAKTLVADAVDVKGSSLFVADGYGGERYIGAVAGLVNANREIEGDSLIDLKLSIKDGKLTWRVPTGRWQVIKFTHKQAPQLGQGGGLSVDGASRDCTDWFIQTVYQPHFDHFKEDFGKTIPGFFYDEPETRGDWGTELNIILAEWGVDWKKAYVAYKFKLAGDDQIAARYQYMEALADAWGRVMYGGMSKWCNDHDVVSIGHFMEHGNLYLRPDFCAGDMMRVQKYSDMGGIDLVVRQMYPGQRPHDIYQTPKIASSISHVYGKTDDIAMCEIFGGYNQVLTYPQMKWLTDQMQVRGVNFMIPHSFNPKAPHDKDYPPYFYNDGLEPRWPLYRVYADWTSRLSLMLTGGRHVCPVALLFSGNAKRVGNYVTPEDMTTVLQDALYDCDWLPFEAFEGDASLDGKDISLHQERYQVLIVPPTEVIPHATLAKAKAFYDQGGVVIGYGFLPSRSGTIGHDSEEITTLRDVLWGQNAKVGTKACKTNAAGGRSYFLPMKPDADMISAVIHQDAGIPPVVEVLDGDTDNWLHVLHRVKENKDIFLLCNQDHVNTAKRFRLRVQAKGFPEIWDAMRNEITSIAFTRHGKQVEFSLVLEPMESVLLVFNQKKRNLPVRIEGDAICAGSSIAVKSDSVTVPTPVTVETDHWLDKSSWVWFPEANPPAGTRYFRKSLTLPKRGKIRSAVFTVTADNFFTLYVNGQAAGKSSQDIDNWRQLKTIDVAKLIKPGANVIAISAVNGGTTANPAGVLGRLFVEYEKGEAVSVLVDTSWKTAKVPQTGWKTMTFDDSDWLAARKVASFGAGAWGRFTGPTPSPVVANPFSGQCTVPDSVDLSQNRVVLSMDELSQEDAARVTINGQYVGGFIGRPFRLDVTTSLKHGVNTVKIEPFAPKSVRLQVLEKKQLQYSLLLGQSNRVGRARQSSEIAGNTISKVQRWLHEVALKKMEPDTGLYHPDGNFNYQDAWADCYPFLVWAAWLTDLDALNGPVRGALHAEIKQCEKGFFADPKNTFGGSEYVKDGLIAIVEVTGKDEWFDRMKAIQDEIWANPTIDTEYGRIPSTNVEVNGEQIQALARLYTMTGETKYLKWAERLADYYLLKGDFVPTRLRDHGCEIIGGLGLLLGVESVHNPAKAKQYLPHMKKMLDTVLEKGTNEDGIMHDTLGPKGRLSDGWGYNYVAYICYDWVASRPVYRAHMEQVLRNLAKPAYKNRQWEGNSIDGFADSVEGGLYIMNRLAVAEGLAWADREVAKNIVYTDKPDHLWGTMKLQSNGVRTAIMHALMHTRGVIARPWQQGLRLGASQANDGLTIALKSDTEYKGKLVFDIPRHRIYMGFMQDWPRMNTMPEWFTVEPGKSYVVKDVATGDPKTYTGKQLHEGLPIELQAGQETLLLITW